MMNIGYKIEKLVYDGEFMKIRKKWREQYDLVIGQISTIPPCKIGNIDFVGQEYLRAQERFIQNC